LVIESNEYQQAKHAASKAAKVTQVVQVDERIVPSAPNKVIKRVLDKKTTVKDSKGDEWEVTEEKRNTYLIERDANSSDAGSELSYD
jgi:hypothetical protein